MIFYIVLILLVSGLVMILNYYPTKENIISLSILVIILIVGGFRDEIGADYKSYIDWYVNKTRDNDFEFGFFILIKLFRYFNFNYKFLFFFFSFFTYLFVYLGIRKYTKNSSLPLVLYILIPSLFLTSFALVRQAFSVAVCFYAFSYLLNRKYCIYCLLMIMGISIHYSSLITFVVFLMVFKWGEFIKTGHLYVLMSLSFIIANIGVIHWLSFLFQESHYYYYFSEKSVAVPVLKLLGINIMGFLVVYYYSKKGFRYSNQRYLLLLYICSILLLNLFLESTQLTRICIYFRIFEIILISEIICKAVLKKRLLLIGLIYCFYVVMFFRAIVMDSERQIKNGLELIPYKNILWSHSSINTFYYTEKF